MPDPQPTASDRYAIARSMLALLVTLVVMGVLLFASAGTLDWPHGWWFCAAFIVATLIAIAVIWRLNPELFAARSRIQPGTRRLD